ESSPGPGATPSMVVMAYPSACTANIRQERAGAPSMSTVQAPHTPCSQPAWAPVSNKRSRRQSSRLMRGSTSTVRVSPLTVNSTRMCGLGSLASIGDRAHGEACRGAPAILGRSVQVGEWLDVGERGAHGLARNVRPYARPFERLRHRIEPQRAGGHCTNAERQTPADTAVVERNLRRGRGEGKVAPACADLVKAHADARIAPARKADGGEAGGRGQRRHHRPDEEIGRRNFHTRGPLAIGERRTERDRDEGDLRRGIGIGERAAYGSARADRSMTDEGHHLGEQRYGGANDGV